MGPFSSPFRIEARSLTYVVNGGFDLLLLIIKHEEQDMQEAENG